MKSKLSSVAPDSLDWLSLLAFSKRNDPNFNLKHYYQVKFSYEQLYESISEMQDKQKKKKLYYQKKLSELPNGSNKKKKKKLQRRRNLTFCFTPSGEAVM